MFSLSSPPQPNSSSFFAPRFHSTHVPQTPSPLRTSRYANLMPTSRAGRTLSDDGSSIVFGSLSWEHSGKQHDVDAAVDENAALGFAYMAATQKTPTGKITGKGQDDSTLITPPDSASTATAAAAAQLTQSSLPTHARQLADAPTSASTSSSFDFTSVFAAPISGARPASRLSTSQWESRARGASPAAALARHAAHGREKKKTQFLDRIRRRRDDDRSEGYGDQVMRMDFVRERRQWEDEMKRRALAEAAHADDADADADADADMLEEDVLRTEEPGETLSPMSEHDVDVDALAADYYQQHVQASNAGLGAGYSDENEFLIVDDDEEYDALFREILSQEEEHAHGQGQQPWGSLLPPQQHHQHSLGIGAPAAESEHRDSRLFPLPQSQDADMDMS